jgi:hypothetical protein
MPFTPAQTREEGAFTLTTPWKDLITKIDDGLLLGTMHDWKAGIVVYAPWQKLPKTFLPALVTLYNSFGWTLSTWIERGMSYEEYMLFVDNTTRCEATQVTSVGEERSRCCMGKDHRPEDKHSFLLASGAKKEGV